MFFKDLFDLFVPRDCLICSTTLKSGESCLCLECQAKLPRVRAEKPDNEAEHRLFGRVPYVHGTAFCYYRKGGEFAALIKDAKYHGDPWINTHLARLFAAELTPEGWPYDIDVIVPIPTHRFRRLLRGYTQTHALADALGGFWHLPVDKKNLVKARFTTSQVSHNKDERLGKMKGTFKLRHPEYFASKHVLLVDDVLTTGATIDACAQLLTEVGAKVSFLTLGLSD